MAEDIGGLIDKYTIVHCTDCTTVGLSEYLPQEWSKRMNSDSEGVKFIGLILICDDSLDLGSCSTFWGACCSQSW